MILDEIVNKKKLQLMEEKKLLPLDELEKRLDTTRACLDFGSALKKPGGLSIIAEVKKASPSKGLIREDFRPVEIAREYRAAEADAISILTEKSFFLGHDDYLPAIREAVDVPLLRKDFIIDLWQVYQSHLLGADAILLITAILTPDELEMFIAAAQGLNMQCLVEVHDEAEMERALDAGAGIIGINNRDLKTFRVDIRTTGRLIKTVPPGTAVVSESGISTRAEMAYVADTGADAVLIGETLMRAPSIRDKIIELRGKTNGQGENLRDPEQG